MTHSHTSSIRISSHSLTMSLSRLSAQIQFRSPTLHSIADHIRAVTPRPALYMIYECIYRRVVLLASTFGSNYPRHSACGQRACFPGDELLTLACGRFDWIMARRVLSQDAIDKLAQKTFMKSPLPPTGRARCARHPGPAVNLLLLRMPPLRIYPLLERSVLLIHCLHARMLAHGVLVLCVCVAVFLLCFVVDSDKRHASPTE